MDYYPYDPKELATELLKILIEKHTGYVYNTEELEHFSLVAIKAARIHMKNLQAEEGR